MKQWIDLSHTINATTPVFPGDRPAELLHEYKLESSGFNQFHFSGNMHIGTHLDGPMHITDDKRFIADIPLEMCTGKGVLIDVTGEKIIRLSKADREQIEPGMVVLFYTGWDKKFGTKEYFETFPGLEEETAQFLVEKRVKMVGLDTPSPDYSPYHIHKILLENDILILENLTRLEQLKEIKNFEVMAFPLRINADSSLVRAVARVGEDENE
jgi:kynurenine formamidase